MIYIEKKDLVSVEVIYYMPDYSKNKASNPDAAKDATPKAGGAIG